MRPLELRLRNFRSYFGPEVVFDFRDRRLVGIVGPIGSGKSSILDGVAFALYGKTPTVAAATKSLIHQRAADAAVLLRFEVDGEIWEAVRMLRRRGASQHALYRYAADGDEDPVEKISLEGEVNARVASLLGLEFDAFGRSVLLAQGRFAEFLRARPADRDRVLKGVFGHDRLGVMREAAKEHAAAAAQEVASLDAVVARLERLDRELVDSKEQLLDSTSRLNLLEAARSEVGTLDERIASAHNAATDSTARLEALAEHGRALPGEDRVAAVAAEAAAAGERRKSVAAVLEKSQMLLVEAEESLVASDAGESQRRAEEAAAVLATVEPLRAALGGAVTRRDRVAQRLEAQRATRLEAAEAVEQVEVALVRATAGLGEAQAVLEEASAAVHEARHAEMVATLRSGLAVDDACPVCEQHVGELPAPIDTPLGDDAEKALAAAGKARDGAEAARATAGQRLAAATKTEESAAGAISGLETELGAAEADAAEAASAVETVEARLESLLGEGDPEELLSAIREGLEALASAATEARDAVDRARTEHDQAIRTEQSAGKAVSALRVELVDVAARAGVTLYGLDHDEPVIQEAYAGLAAAIADETSRAGEAAESCRGDLEAAQDARSAIMARLDIDGEFAGALGEVTARVELISRGIDRISAEREEDADAFGRRAAAAAVRATYDRLVSDLGDARFVRYLLDDERTRLAALGSDHFMRLSGGRYVFSNDGRFNIVDQTAAEAGRKADSLSGGETFLASLALALSLAEMVARTGGRLDAFFLDEGFGSLDPEHFDLAMEGVEALVAHAGDRLVVVVSHVRELRERIEDLIVLDRDPMTGDTRVVRS